MTTGNCFQLEVFTPTSKKVKLQVTVQMSSFTQMPSNVSTFLLPSRLHKNAFCLQGENQGFP